MANWATVARRIRVPLGFVLAGLYLWLAHPSAISLAAGMVIAAFGLILRAAASGHVRKNRVLATTGPYAYNRNPLYLGSMIIGAGFAVAARNPWIVVAMLALFVAVYLPVIEGEERYLRSQFPEYDEYARRVPRLGIKFGNRPDGKGAFSWDLYRQHREYNAFIGAVLMMAALAVKLWWQVR